MGTITVLLSLRKILLSRLFLPDSKGFILL
jgi:hypothetical protein